VSSETEALLEIWKGFFSGETRRSSGHSDCFVDKLKFCIDAMSVRLLEKSPIFLPNLIALDFSAWKTQSLNVSFDEIRRGGRLPFHAPQVLFFGSTQESKNFRASLTAVPSQEDGETDAHARLRMVG
jgi:hypothetical protein